MTCEQTMQIVIVSDVSTHIDLKATFALPPMFSFGSFAFTLADLAEELLVFWRMSVEAKGT